MLCVNIALDGSVDVEKIELGNQYENNDETIQFALPDKFKNYHKYIIAVYKDKKTTRLLPLNNDILIVTSTITALSGSWYMYVMCRENSIDLLSENIDISPKGTEHVFLSDEFIGVVNTSKIKSEVFENTSMDANLKNVYDDLLELKEKLQNIKDGVTPNLTIGNVTTLSSDEEATATITGTKENPVLNLGIPKGKDGEVVTSEGTPIPTKDTYGEKLIAEYIHQGNQEIHFTEFDWETGIGTTSEPHGLKNNTDVMIVPNDWYTGNWANIKHIPFEWLSHTGKIYVIPINETQLKVVQKDQTTLFSLSNSISQLPLNATMFHFEIPTNWLIKNLNTNSLRFKIDIYGLYRAHHYRYMYFNGRLKNEPVGTDKYLAYITEYFNAPRVQNLLPATYHGLIGTNTIEVNFTLKKAWVYKIDGYFKGQRPYAQSPYEDKVTETIRQLIPDNRDIVEITTIGNSNGYAFLANQSQIRIYAMSEEPQDE